MADDTEQGQDGTPAPPTVGEALDAQIAKVTAARDAARAAFTQADADFNAALNDLQEKRQTFAAWINHELHAAEEAIVKFFRGL